VPPSAQFDSSPESCCEEENSVSLSNSQ